MQKNLQPISKLLLIKLSIFYDDEAFIAVS